MSNPIKIRRGTLTDFVLNPSSLADGAVRQADMISEPNPGFERHEISCQVTLGTDPNKGEVPIYLIKGDAHGSSPIRTDGAGPSEGTITIVGASLLGILPTKDGPATNDVLRGVFTLIGPPAEWTIACGNETGVALKSDGHKFRYQGFNPEVQ